MSNELLYLILSGVGIGTLTLVLAGHSLYPFGKTVYKEFFRRFKHFLRKSRPIDMVGAKALSRIEKENRRFRKDNLGNLVWSDLETPFLEGESVIIIDDNDQFWWGKLSICDNGCVLTRPSTLGNSLTHKLISWNDIAFMSHDGFPIQKLQGADGSPSIEKLNNASMPLILRSTIPVQPVPAPQTKETAHLQAIIQQFQTACDEQKDTIQGLNVKLLEAQARIKRHEDRSSSSYSGSSSRSSGSSGQRDWGYRANVLRGDPFLIEDVAAALLYPGNAGPQFWGTGEEECMRLTAKDGAKANLFDLSTVYFFEQAMNGV